MNKELFDVFNSEDFDMLADVIDDNIPKEITDSRYTILEHLLDKLPEILTIDGIACLLSNYFLFSKTDTLASESYNENTGDELPFFRIEVHSSYNSKNDPSKDFDNAQLGIGISYDMLNTIAKTMVEVDIDNIPVVIAWMKYNKKNEINFENPNITIEAEYGYYLDDLEDDK